MYAARVERGGEQWEIFVSHNPRPPPFQLVVEQGFQGGREINAWGKATKATKATVPLPHEDGWPASYPVMDSAWG